MATAATAVIAQWFCSPLLTRQQRFAAGGDAVLAVRAHCSMVHGDMFTDKVSDRPCRCVLLAVFTLFFVETEMDRAPPCELQYIVQGALQSVTQA
jgi:hypothetical protein